MTINLVYVTHPSEYICDELEARKWTVLYLSELLNYNLDETEALVHGVIDINDRIASDLGRVFDTSKEMWLNLQNIYDIHKS